MSNRKNASHTWYFSKKYVLLLSREIKETILVETHGSSF